jgi:hypothetical protein
MSIVERRNLNRRKNRFQEKKVEVEKEEISKDDEATRQKISAQNARKAEAARLRYHRMTPEEKKIYNQRRTEAFRHRRVEEDVLLALPVGKYGNIFS